MVLLLIFDVIQNHFFIAIGIRQSAVSVGPRDEVGALLALFYPSVGGGFDLLDIIGQ